MKLLHKKALITGSSRGIGKAIALGLAAEGCDVVINYRSSEQEALALLTEIEAMGVRATCIKADLSDNRDTEFLCEQALSFLGGLDILVNSAGVFQNNSIADMPLEEWNNVITVNLSAVFVAIKSCLPALKQSLAGRIINISSQAAWVGSANRCAYSASKSGLSGLTYSLAKELGPFGITINMVSPGRIVTDMIKDDLLNRSEEWLKITPLKRFGEAEEVSSLVNFLVSDEAAYITGANINVNGGIVMG